MRVREVEERQLAIIPNSSFDPCYRCGERIVVTPAMQGIRRSRRVEPWCWDCLWATNPHGFNLAVTREIMLESILLHRLNEGGGPIH